MAKGYYLVFGDKTICEGKILSNELTHTIMGKHVACDLRPAVRIAEFIILSCMFREIR
ncbi:hypothetical protein F4826_003529 [Rahnella inusitata]|nr:hypothetical protein [Rahnella inusitata]